jgi:hypothetical protein
MLLEPGDWVHDPTFLFIVSGVEYSGLGIF